VETVEVEGVSVHHVDLVGLICPEFIII